jgi:hypothetical protein
VAVTVTVVEDKDSAVIVATVEEAVFRFLLFLVMMALFVFAFCQRRLLLPKRWTVRKAVNVETRVVRADAPKRMQMMEEDDAVADNKRRNSIIHYSEALVKSL